MMDYSFKIIIFVILVFTLNSCSKKVELPIISGDWQLIAKAKGNNVRFEDSFFDIHFHSSIFMRVELSELCLIQQPQFFLDTFEISPMSRGQFCIEGFDDVILLQKDDLLILICLSKSSSLVFKRCEKVDLRNKYCNPKKGQWGNPTLFSLASWELWNKDTLALNNFPHSLFIDSAFRYSWDYNVLSVNNGRAYVHFFVESYDGRQMICRPAYNNNYGRKEFKFKRNCLFCFGTKTEDFSVDDHNAIVYRRKKVQLDALFQSQWGL